MRCSTLGILISALNVSTILSLTFPLWCLVSISGNFIWVLWAVAGGGIRKGGAQAPPELHSTFLILIGWEGGKMMGIAEGAFHVRTSPGLHDDVCSIIFSNEALRASQTVFIIVKQITQWLTFYKLLLIAVCCIGFYFGG